MRSATKFALAAFTALLSGTHAHMIMLTPTPFNNQTIDNSPLGAGGGGAFPCKSTGTAAFYDATGIDNTMAIGEPQTLSFRGSAVHGGGSCQLALTTDLAPTPTTTWQVIHSIEGGCPSVDGNGPSTYQYSIPDTITPGKYVFTWIWISKLAGQPEYYMNCAPVTVTAGSSTKKRSPSKRATLPNLFVANLDVNTCKTVPGTDPLFPDPGDSVAKPGTTPNYAAVTATDCLPQGATDTSSGGSGTGSSPSGAASSAASSAVVSSPATSSPVASSPATPSTTIVSTPVALPTSTGAVGSFPNATSSSSAVATPESTAAATSVSAASPTGSSSSGSGTTSSSSGALTGACTDEGMWNCIAGSSFQRCASGTWSSVTPMAAGTSCTPGQSDSFTVLKRSARFSREHLKRYSERMARF